VRRWARENTVSREEVVDLYLRGEIGRRTFIRKLVGLGVSATAAATYAGLLVPQPALAARGDFYGPYHPGDDHYNPPPTTATAAGAPASGQPGGEQPSADKAGPALGVVVTSFGVGDLVQAAAVSVELSSDEAATVELQTTLSVTRRRRRALRFVLAKQIVTFDGAGGRTVRVPLGRAARSALRSASGASVACTAKATDRAGNTTQRTAAAKGSAA
jgi:hypothetical protein